MKMNGFRKLLAGILLSVLLIPAYFSSAQKFTIPVIPDSQEAVTRKYSMFFKQMEWLADYKDSMNMPIALHVGDLVNFDNIQHWEIASLGYSILDKAKLPYVITLGNHDTEAVQENGGSAAPGNVNANVRKTFKFNKYFPGERFALKAGEFEPGKSDNSFHLFEAGGMKWIVVALEFCARESAAQWMSDVLKSHPDRNAIVVTHFHLTPTGEISPSNAGYGDMNVSEIFEKYIRPHKNVLLVLSGHVCYSSHREDKGPEGNTIYQILSDYQCWDNGGGYLRLLEIDPGQRTIHAFMYSPYYHKILDDYSDFTFTDVNFIKP